VASFFTTAGAGSTLQTTATGFITSLFVGTGARGIVQTLGLVLDCSGTRLGLGLSFSFSFGLLPLFFHFPGRHSSLAGSNFLRLLNLATCGSALTQHFRVHIGRVVVNFWFSLFDKFFCCYSSFYGSFIDLHRCHFGNYCSSIYLLLFSDCTLSSFCSSCFSFEFRRVTLARPL